MDCENASYPLFDLFLTILPFHVPGSHAFIITAPPCYEISGQKSEIPQIDYFSFHPAYEFHSLIPNDLP
jgi:hypothetical protein